VENLSGDHRIPAATIRYMSWFYQQAANVFVRSSAYRFKLLDLGISESRLLAIAPAIDTARFGPAHRDVNVWSALGITQPKRLMYAGRVSVEKNLPMLVDLFKRLCAMRDDVALIVAGDGPYLDRMRRDLDGLPVHFAGFKNDADLARLYASSDLFVFPSRTDTLGQVVMEAQACGLPAVVGAEGGPKELVADGASGIIVPSNAPADWASVIHQILSDEP